MMTRDVWKPLPPVRIALTKAEWIEMYGGQELLDREGYEVVPCVDCDDTICHGWRVVPAASQEVQR